MERPIERSFDINPVETVLRNRGPYIAAALTISRAYFVAGMPGRLKRIGDTFGGWSDLVRSALVWLGRHDPVATMEIARGKDLALQEQIRVFHAIDAVFPEQPFFVKDLVRKCEMSESLGDRSGILFELRDALLGIAGPKTINSKRLGKWFSRHKESIAGGLRLEGVGNDANEGVMQWIFIRIR